MPSRICFFGLCIVAAATASVAFGQTAEPYEWHSVAIGGGGFMPGIEFSPVEKNLYFTRADIGGAYRWDPAANRWTPLLDWVTPEQENYYGVESIALDPTDANRVYMACGEYSAGWAPDGVILCSNDRGESWQIGQIPVKMGGNENGRSIGERLAVDPHLSSRLYFGSRHNGLWISEDRGQTWTNVKSFPLSGRASGLGVGFIVFDSAGKPGQPSPIIYAGVIDGSVHLYRSEDAGLTWSLVPGQPKRFIPHHAVFASDGSLYISYCDGPGPNGVNDGSVQRYEARSGTWTDITPMRPPLVRQGFGYAGLTVDAQHPQTVMVSTMDRWNPGDDIFRTTDGGKTWKSLAAFSARNDFPEPFLRWSPGPPPLGHWIGSLEIDPFDSNHALYVTGATIWSCNDLTEMDFNRPTHWTVCVKGIEETAVLELLSPPSGAHLLSALGDICGFRHDDVNVVPTDGFFTNPRFSSTRSMDFAEEDADLIVRTGDGPPGQNAAYSLDGAHTWTPFALPQSGRGRFGGRGGGGIAVSADGQRWISSIGRGGALFTVDRGKSWTPCRGIAGQVTILSDRINPNQFYALNSSNGTFYASSDGGATFMAMARNLPRAASQLRVSPAASGALLVPAGDAGLLRTTDAGKAFARLPDITTAYAVGFGKAGEPGRPPAIYLSGKVGAVEGIFRSDDNGATWHCLSDAHHHFGWVGIVIGDPRIFGRVYLGTNGRGVPYGDPEK